MVNVMGMAPSGVVLRFWSSAPAESLLKEAFIFVLARLVSGGDESFCDGRDAQPVIHPANSKETQPIVFIMKVYHLF